MNAVIERQPMYLPQPDTQEDKDARFQMDCEQAKAVCRELRRIKGLTPGCLEIIVGNLAALVELSTVPNKECVIAQLVDATGSIQ